MEEKDVIDVEVVEEEVEIIPDGPQENMEPNEVEPQFTDQEVDEKVRFLKDSIIDNNYQSNETIARLAKELAQNSKEYLDNDTYLWVMYAYALGYRESDNKNAERFCFIRMSDVIAAENGKEHKPKALTFTANTLDEHILKEVVDNTAFIEDVVAGIKKQFIMMEAVVLLVFVLILMFLLRYDLMTTLLFTGAVALFNVLFTYRRLKRKFFLNQTNTSKSYCQDEELLQFDLPVANS